MADANNLRQILYKVARRDILTQFDIDTIKDVLGTPESVFSASYQDSPDRYVVISGATPALTSAHNGKVVVLSGANAVLTIPAGLGKGYSVTVIQSGTGNATLSNTSPNTTLSKSNFTKFAGGGAEVKLKFLTATQVSATGDLVTT